MSQPDMQDIFNERVTDSSGYPMTLIRQPRLHHYQRRARHVEYLKNNDSRLFDDTEPRIRFLEARHLDKKLQTCESTSLDTLTKYLDRAEKDPMIRQAFINPQSSRSPLDCSTAMFKLLLTFHQVDDSFLDPVYTFGEQIDGDQALDLCLSNFYADDTLAVPESQVVKLPQRGRSGRQLNLAYLIRSVERVGTGVWSWRIRPAAVYHSFDTETGRSFWLTIKGNGLFFDRIMKSHDFLSSCNQGSDPNQDIAACLRSSLATHLVYFAWCDENWREYINDLEAKIFKLVDEARTAPIDRHLKKGGSTLKSFPRSIQASRTNTMNDKGPRRASFGHPTPGIAKQSTWDRLRHVSQHLSQSLSNNRSTKPVDVEMANIDDEDTSEPLADPKEILDRFRFSDIQTLENLNYRIQTALLTVKLDCGTMEGISKYYGKLVASQESFGPLASECAVNIRDFQAQVQLLLNSLHNRMAQLDFLVAEVAKGVTLYARILQYRNLYISQWFAENTEDTANKTSKQTTSMHFITILTLIFLPATFVSTLAQSGIFMWSDAPADMKGRYEYSIEGVRLFFAICGPLMALTFGAWLISWRGRKERTCSRLLSWPSWKAGHQSTRKLA